MDPHYWHHKWETNDIGFNQSQPNKLMQRFFPLLNLTPGCRVLVPLCGQSIDMLWLVEQGYQVIGVELSPRACHAFFNDHHLAADVTETDDFMIFHGNKITLFCGDFFKIHHSMVDPIDVIYDRAALIALPHEVRRRYASHVLTLVAPSAAMFIITTTYAQREMEGPPFSVDEDEIASLYSARFEIHQLYSKAFEIPDHLSVKGLRQACEHAYACISKS